MHSSRVCKLHTVALGQASLSNVNVESARWSSDHKEGYLPFHQGFWPMEQPANDIADFRPHCIPGLFVAFPALKKFGSVQLRHPSRATAHPR